MPMGVTNGNATFQRMLENLLELVRDCADPFVDDVIIASGVRPAHRGLQLRHWRSSEASAG